MLHINAISAYVLSLGLLTLFLLVWVAQRQRSLQAGSVGFISGGTGLLLGAIGAYGVLCATGYDVVRPAKNPPTTNVSTDGPPAGAPPMVGGGGMGMGGGMPGGGMGGMMGGMGGGPNPKRDLTTLVRKLDLLTGDIGIKLTPEQTTSLMKGLAGVDEADLMSDDDAKAKHDELFAILDDDQKSQLAAVGLPFGGRGGGPGGGGGGAPGGVRGAPAGMDPRAGGPPNPDTNPFKQDVALKSLASFRSRFGSQPAAESADSGKTAP